MSFYLVTITRNNGTTITLLFSSTDKRFYSPDKLPKCKKELKKLTKNKTIKGFLIEGYLKTNEKTPLFAYFNKD